MFSPIKEIGVQGLVEAMGRESVTLIDVRTEMEVAQGKIDGATHIPLHLLPLRAEDLPKDQRVVFYCRSGARSSQACAFMLSKGHDQVYNLRGGILAWIGAGGPVAVGA
jgi:rhodanese-related sulfurtransferase